jgi:hypothetical protein
VVALIHVAGHSAELLKGRREPCAKRGIPCPQFADETCRGHSQSAAQLRLIERADECLCERTGHGGGEAIDTAPEDGVLSQAEAGEGERVIADPADPVFGLPRLALLDARAGVEDVVPAEPDEVSGGWLRRGLLLTGRAEEAAEARAAPPKSCWGVTATSTSRPPGRRNTR